MTPNEISDLNFEEDDVYKRNTLETIQNPQYICDICGKMYKHKSNLEMHLEIHNGTSGFTCEFCGKLFSQKISLRRHLPIHTKIPQFTVSIP